MIFIIKFYIQYYFDIERNYLNNHILKLFLLYNKIFEIIIDNKNIENILYLYETKVSDIKNFIENKFKKYYLNYDLSIHNNIFIIFVFIII